MPVVIFYAFAVLAVGSAFVVVTTRNVVNAAFALMVTLFCVAAFYVYLDAHFLAAIQLLVYVGGILVLVLFGVMMTSGNLLMKLRAPVGQLVPALIVGVVLLGLLLNVALVEAPWEQFVLVRDDGGSALQRVEAARGGDAHLADLDVETVLPRLSLRYTDRRTDGPPANRLLSDVVDRVLYSVKDRPGFKRLYVVRSRPATDASNGYDVIVERRVTSLSDHASTASISDSAYSQLETMFADRTPIGFELESVDRPRMAYVSGVDAQARRSLIEDLELQPVESMRTVVGLGDAVMLGEFLLPFEVVGVVLLVALIGAAVISRKGVAA